jgi:hypothetical protein
VETNGAGFSAVGTSVLDPFFVQTPYVGSGVGYNQGSGSLNITTGVATNAEFLARSKWAFSGPLRMRFSLIASQRIVNNNLAVMLADLIGENLAYTIVNSTTVDVQIVAHGFTHVVQCERGDRRAGERFHLDAGFRVGLRAAGDENFRRAIGCRRLVFDGDFTIIQRERMTERDEFARALGAHDAGQNRRLKYRAFLRRDIAVAQQRRQRRRQHHDGPSLRDAVGHGLGADIDHRGLTLGVEVGKHTLKTFIRRCAARKVELATKSPPRRKRHDRTRRKFSFIGGQLDKTIGIN